MGKNNKTEKSRSLELDGIRGIAVLLVVLFHTYLYFAPLPGWSIFERPLRLLFEAGWFGVDLFFVLSGFLITGILLDTKKATHYFKNFYARRTLRIFPLYYVTLIFFIFLLPNLVEIENEVGSVSIPENQLWLWFYVQNFLIVLKEQALGMHLNHLWTLAVEEQFYLVWPCAVFFLEKRRFTLLCIWIVLGVPLFRLALYFNDASPHFLYFSTFTRVDTLAAGGLAAVLMRSNDGVALIKRWTPSVLVASLVAIIGVIFYQRGYHYFAPGTQTLGYSLNAFFFTALITGTLLLPGWNWLGRIFRFPLLRFLGKYSYAIYIIHWPAILLALNVVNPSSLASMIGINSVAALFFALILLSFSLLMAILSWHLLEMHFLRLKKHFSYQVADKDR